MATTPQRLLLFLIFLSIVACCIVLLLSQQARSLLSPYKDLIGFVVSVVVVALILWLVRTIVESQPDPFFLNLTFFAFAGQFIRTAEAYLLHKATGSLYILLVAAFVFLLLEVFVTKTHERVTISLYKKRLEDANKEPNKEPCSTGEIHRLAKLLVKITGTDLNPGSYSWLESFFEGEPKEERKKDAVSILPRTQFDPNSQWLKPKQLTVSDPDRKMYWLPYVLLPACSWLVFVWALFVSR